MRFITIFLLTFSLLLIATFSYATHNRAGEITYVQTGDLSIRCTITTYTKASSVPADRDSLTICWDINGPCETIGRVNGPVGPGGTPQGEILPNDTKRNLYVLDHIYPGFGHYVISMQDPNRNAGICNVNEPNSVEVPFYIQTTVTLTNPNFDGPNNSPILLQPPIDIGCVGQPFIHNPNAFEPDGDSLAYEFVTPQQAPNTNVPNYVPVNLIGPGPFNNLSINRITGDILWESPQIPCEYNIAIQIIEFRDGIPIDTLIRDMQILIKECDNQPPEIATIDEICVIAGELLEFDVVATDPDINPPQEVELTALGGPFQVSPSPAVFDVPSGFQQHPVSGTFRWQTTCEHISDQFYSVVFKAVDNHPVPLANLKTVRIKVVGPPPEDIQAEALSGEIDLSWELPYQCDQVADEYFRGFSIWRKVGPQNVPFDECEPGLDGQGYTRVAFDFQQIEGGRYTYRDTDVERGRTYCYRVLGEFARVSEEGITYNRVQSLRSEEVCIQLSRDIPLITNVDVEITDAANGQIFVRWTKPIAEDLDTIMNPGPYRYQLLRGTGINPATFEEVPGASFISPTFAGANDTTFVDNTSLNTVDNPYTYEVAFYVNNESQPLGITPEASSVFLEISPTDNANILNWSFEVPWENTQYIIYRRDPDGVTFDSIDQTGNLTYRDDGLKNGLEYCYYVESIGSYGVAGTSGTLINKSQQVCSIPVDNVAPCPPPLEVTNECDIATSSTAEDDFFNFLDWGNPTVLCDDTDDVVAYNVYYTPTEGGEFQLIETINSPDDSNYEHQSEFGVAGCYAVTALDTNFLNESAFSNIVCIDNCPVYELPNAFTPNGDGQNDFFNPFPYRFVERIDMQIYNRWGQLVFETEDPDINWDGTNLNGDNLAEGTYFYKAKVFEKRLEGVIENMEILSGYIELIRSERR